MWSSAPIATTRSRTQERSSNMVMESLVSVSLHDGMRFDVNAPIPNTGTDPNTPNPWQGTVIRAMFLVDGGVEVFADEAPGSSVLTGSEGKMGVHITLMPLSIKTVVHFAAIADWRLILAAHARQLTEDLQDFVYGSGGDGEEEEEEEEKETPQAARPAQPRPAGPPIPAFTPPPGAPVP